MPHIFIITGNADTIKRTLSVNRYGFRCSIASKERELNEQVAAQSPDIVLITLDGRANEFARRVRQNRRFPIIALVDKKDVTGVATSDFDDFIVEPLDIGELVVRINRLLQRASRATGAESIKAGDMTIDLARCEVDIEDRPVQLTFKEYELLKFLASNPGRVFSRDAILNKVWGYDYYGGDRTVDVHIRRLRSKLEEASGQNYVETVRNIGYRFRTGG